ncbi:MAG: DMT family transporter [Rhizobiaceae bacterium]
MGGREWLLLLILSLLWGGSFFFNGIAVRELPVLTIVFLRVCLAAMVLWLIAIARGNADRAPARTWQVFLVMGLLNNIIPFTLIVRGQAEIASGLASILNATTPLFTVVIAHFMTSDEKLTRLRLTGVLCGIAGVVVLTGVGNILEAGSFNTAQLMCLGAALSYGFATIFGRRFRAMGVEPMAAAKGQLTASSILLLPVVLMVDKPWALPVPGVTVIASVVCLAVLCSALGYAIFFRVLSTAGATNLSIVTFLIPVSAIWLGWLFLDETLLARHFAGLALIGAGLAAIDGRPVALVVRAAKRAR